MHQSLLMIWDTHNTHTHTHIHTYTHTYSGESSGICIDYLGHTQYTTNKHTIHTYTHTHTTVKPAEYASMIWDTHNTHNTHTNKHTIHTLSEVSYAPSQATVTVTGKVQETPCSKVQSPCSQGSTFQDRLGRLDGRSDRESCRTVAFDASFMPATGVRLDAALMSTDQPDQSHVRRLPLMRCS